MSDTLTFAQYLKENSRTTHDSVDTLVMSVKPFDNTENYIRFLQLQAVFHKIVDSIYKDPALNRKIDNLAELARYDAVMQDLRDLAAAEKPSTCPCRNRRAKKPSAGCIAPKVPTSVPRSCIKMPKPNSRS